MKFEYDMSKNYYNCYKEAQSFVLYKRKFKKGRPRFVFNYCLRGVFYILVFLLIHSYLLLLFSNSNYRYYIDIYLFFVIAVMVAYYLAFFIGYIIENRKSHKGEIILDEFGITDIEGDTKVSFAWNRIIAVVAGKHTVTFVTNTFVVFFVEVDHKENIFKAIDKYNDKTRVIDLMNENIK